jgi:UDP-galactopyranose mutase
MYDYLIVGSGLFGATFAALAIKEHKKVLVVEKKNVLGGAIRTERRDNIDIHLYGPHIFHTSDKKVWDFVNSYSEMNNFVNQPLACYKGKLYHLPFNMNTFQALWGVITPAAAKKEIARQVKEAGITDPKNLREQALSLVGRDVFRTLIQGYTEKQWGRKCEALPSSIIKRLPLRFTYDNNYFNDRYQGVPYNGYTALIDALLTGADIQTSTDFLADSNFLLPLASKVVYTGEIDRFYAYRFGKLEYRTLRFETHRFKTENYQGNAVINYTERKVPYTRVIEHKFFNYRESPVTYVTKEYPKEYRPGDDAFYPIQDERNTTLYKKYEALAATEAKVFFAGRLGQYRYYDMDDTIASAMSLYEDLK